MPKYKKNSDQKKYFDNIANHYSEDNRISVDYLQRIRKASSPYISGNVLDIGNGGVVCFDYKKASRITLADIAFDLLKNPKAIKNRKLMPITDFKLKCVEANVMDLSFASNSFDTVILFNVAHHLSVPSLKDSITNIERAFKEINRVLKKDGVFLLADNCPPFYIKMLFDPLFEFAYWLLIKFKIPLPYFLSLMQVKSLLQNSGFELKSVEKIKLSDKAYQPLLPWFTPPGWLWDELLGNRLFVVRKNTSK